MNFTWDNIFKVFFIIFVFMTIYGIATGQTATDGFADLSACGAAVSGVLALMCRITANL